jgi:heme-degrading monooxygenase HmoA
MFGRINYVTFKTDRLADVRRMWPQGVASYRGKGFEAGYLLLEPSTGESISVVVFKDEASCRGNEKGGDFTKAETPFRELRKTEPDRHYFDVAATVPSDKSDPIGYARLAKPWLKVATQETVVQGWPGHVASYKKEPGFRGAYLFLDRKTGECLSLSLWGSKADCEANEKSGAFMATVDPYKEYIAKAPTRSYHDVAAVVRP